RSEEADQQRDGKAFDRSRSELEEEQSGDDRGHMRVDDRAECGEKPFSIAARTVFPSRRSSRMRSNTSTFESTAMPSVRMMPAMPGSVRVALKYAIMPSRMIRLRNSASTALIPAPL